jgi:hypothetical protein
MDRRIGLIRLERVALMPQQLEAGVLYLSETYGTAIHLCACGCGIETVTPLGAGGWTFTEGPTLRPSVGNQAMPCASHYFITAGRVDWC